MNEHDHPQGAHEGRKHVFYLLGLLLVGLVTYSVAASIGLSLAMKRNGETKSETSVTTPSSETSTPPAAAPTPNRAQ